MRMYENIEERARRLVLLGVVKVGANRVMMFDSEPRPEPSDVRCHGIVKFRSKEGQPDKKSFHDVFTDNF